MKFDGLQFVLLIEMEIIKRQRCLLWKLQLDDCVMKVVMFIWVLTDFSHVKLLSYFCNHSAMITSYENVMNNVSDIA